MNNFLRLITSKSFFYCIGDININLLKISKNDAICRYASMFSSCNCWCVIDVPTHVCTSSSILIDHICASNKVNSTSSRVVTTTGLNDHYGIFTIISECIHKKNSIKTNLRSKRYVKL